MTTTTFSGALAEAMTARGVTQQQLADGVGVKQNTVSRWVHGEGVPEPAKVFEVERALEIAPGALSMHLGYLPLPVTSSPCTVVEAIKSAEELEDFHREALLSVYRSFLTRSA